jgi:outer membrane protein TolC
MRTIRALFLCAIASFATPARADAPRGARERFDARIVALVGHSGGLTADRVAERARATSLELESQRQNVRIADAAVHQAFIAFFPRLSGVASFARESSLPAAVLGTVAAPLPGAVPDKPIPEGQPLLAVPLTLAIPDEQTIFRADLTIPVSDYILRLAQSFDAAKRSRDAATLDEKATALRVQTDARVAYYAWVGAELQRIVAQAALEQAEEHLTDIQPAWQVGTASKADVLRFESQKASAELLVEQTENTAHVQMERLRVAMHDPDGTMYEIGESFPDTFPEIRGLGTAEQVFDAAAGRRIELRSLETQRESVESQRQASRAGWLPRIDAVAEAMDANPNPRAFPPTQTFTPTWSVGVQATWTVNDTFNAIEQHRALQAREEAVDAQRRVLLDGLRNEVFQAVEDVHQTRVALETSARGLAAAEESYRVRNALFQAGRAIATELTDAEADLTRARLESLNARVNVRLAQVRFEHAAGLDVH